MNWLKRGWHDLGLGGVVFCTVLWVIGIAGAILGIWGDKYDWWESSPFLTNLVSSFVGLAFGVPFALIVIQRFSATQAERIQQRNAVALATRSFTNLERASVRLFDENRSATEFNNIAVEADIHLNRMKQLVGMTKELGTDGAWDPRRLPAQGQYWEYQQNARHLYDAVIKIQMMTDSSLGSNEEFQANVNEFNDLRGFILQTVLPRLTEMGIYAVPGVSIERLKIPARIRSKNVSVFSEDREEKFCHFVLLNKLPVEPGPEFIPITEMGQWWEAAHDFSRDAVAISAFVRESTYIAKEALRELRYSSTS